MKLTALLTLLLPVLLVSACSDANNPLNLPEGFELRHSEVNVHFVYLHPALLEDKKIHREGCRLVCEGLMLGRDCEVFMWSDASIIPLKLPIRNEESFVHAYCKITSDNKVIYKCKECP